jgi:hypothetical protein
VRGIIDVGAIEEKIEEGQKEGDEEAIKIKVGIGIDIELDEGE